MGLVHEGRRQKAEGRRQKAEGETHNKLGGTQYLKPSVRMVTFLLANTSAWEAGIYRSETDTESCLITPDSGGRTPCAPTDWPVGNRRYGIRIRYEFWWVGRRIWG
ncbi:MAG: hypothetical protein EA368_16375 [Leptolyngbya sp. DLM2.Bin27]|nr:MAG: hypothetical protein EA368_16375 [Leptolyngbya sp. DLM2.Bin27]